MDDLSTRATPLDRARALFDQISDQAAASERLGRLTDGIAGTMLDARLFEILIPDRYGGWGAGMGAFFEAVEEIARADGSAGWCASLCNIINHTAFVGLPPEGRDEVFGHGPVACWAALAPNAVATPEAGGYRVSCPGAFGSGSSLSSWVLVATNTGAPGDGEYRAFLVPKSEVEIKAGSWDVMGLRATASVDYAIRDRLVPARRTWTYRWTPKGEAGPLSATESVRLNAIGLAGFTSGIARRAMSELIQSATGAKRVASDAVAAEDNAVQFGLGELDGRLRAARGHLVALVAALDERLASGRPTTFEEGIELGQATQTLARAAREMVIFAFDYSSTSVVYARQPLQRCLRDIFTGLKHAAFTPSLLGRIGKVRLGLPYGGSAL
ncbi:MAG: Butyryl-CoA dehydrogenase [Caulobacteraceae bacterium]|nr:Butyryl-CoA dehydrogenase [Caulobacteraceae bacterium]